MQIIPVEQPFGTFVNNATRYLQCTPFAALINQDTQAYPVDPMLGQVIPGTTLKWEDATQVQKLIWVWFSASGTQTSESMQAIVDAYRGPALPWNNSYAQWGLTKAAA